MFRDAQEVDTFNSFKVLGLKHPKAKEQFPHLVESSDIHQVTVQSLDMLAVGELRSGLYGLQH